MTDTTTDQAQPQSVFDRIAAEFDPGWVDEAQEEPVEEEESAEPEDVEVEYDGERFRVPKKLEKAILQERDYTRKAQEVAEQKRLIEHERQAAKAARIERDFHEAVAPDMREMERLESLYAQLRSVDVRNLPFEDQNTHLADLVRVPQDLAKLEKQIASKRVDFEGKAREAFEDLKKSAREALSKAIPNFSDEILTGIREQAVSAGFSEQDVDGILMDPRSSSVLYKAMRWDQLQANKVATVQKATSPVVKPGSSNPMPQGVRDKLAYQKAMKSAKTSRDKAVLIEERLAGIY